jgi:hypothetical protein
MDFITYYAYQRVAKHQHKHERKMRRSLNYMSYIAKINLLQPLLDALPKSPRFYGLSLKLARGNKVVLTGQFLTIEPFLNHFDKWYPFETTISITEYGDLTLDKIKFKKNLPAYLADNEPQIWTLLLEALYQPE